MSDLNCHAGLVRQQDRGSGNSPIRRPFQILRQPICFHRLGRYVWSSPTMPMHEGKPRSGRTFSTMTISASTRYFARSRPHAAGVVPASSRHSANSLTVAPGTLMSRRAVPCDEQPHQRLPPLDFGIVVRLAWPRQTRGASSLRGCPHHEISEGLEKSPGLKV